MKPTPGSLALQVAVKRPSTAFEGIVLMALLAYTIFTITLVLQRKMAARGLSLGLVSLIRVIFIGAKPKPEPVAEEPPRKVTPRPAESRRVEPRIGAE